MSCLTPSPSLGFFFLRMFFYFIFVHFDSHLWYVLLMLYFLRIPSSTIVTDDYLFVFCVVVVVGLIHILSSSNWKCRYQKLWVISPMFLPSFFALPFVSYEIYLFYSTRGVLFQFISLLLLSWILSFTDCQLISFLVSSFIITSFLVLAFSDRFPWWWHFDWIFAIFMYKFVSFLLSCLFGFYHIFSGSFSVNFYSCSYSS